jgi:ATP adenylyltransferase
MDYIRSLEKPAGDECFLCAGGLVTECGPRRGRLVLWCSDHCVVMMNRYPYTNGHLLIAPRAHVADLDLLDDDQALDLHKQTVLAEKLLKRAISPQGFNIGINVGRAAGAGVPGHLHQHVVPRWSGDVNYMAVIGEVRVLPQALTQMYDELMKVVPDVVGLP